MVVWEIPRLSFDRGKGGRRKSSKVLLPPTSIPPFPPRLTVSKSIKIAQSAEKGADHQPSSHQIFFFTLPSPLSFNFSPPSSSSMSLFYLPTEPTSFSSPHSHSHHQHHHQHRTQPSCPRFELGFPPQQQQQQQRSFNPFELNPLTTSPPHHLPRHPHHHQQPPTTSYRPSQSLPFDPVEAHKQRLLAEFAQSLDQLYPSTSSSSTPPPRQQHPVVSSHETERIRYLEAQLKEQQLRKELEAERIRLARAKEVQRREEEEEEERRREAVVEKQRQEVSRLLRSFSSLRQRILICNHLSQYQKLHHAYLIQQQQLAEEEQQLRRRFLEQRQQQQQRQEQQQSSSLGGLEQFLALLTGSESPRREIEPPVQQEKVRSISLISRRVSLLFFSLTSLLRPSFARRLQSPSSTVSTNFSPSLKLSRTVPSLELVILRSRRRR